MFLLLSSSLLFCITLEFNDTFMEFLSTLFSLFFLRLILSPSLIILLDYDLILIPRFTIHSSGYQWAWTSNPSFNYSYFTDPLTPAPHFAIPFDYVTCSSIRPFDHVDLARCSYYSDHYIVSSYYLILNVRDKEEILDRMLQNVNLSISEWRSFAFHSLSFDSLLSIDCFISFPFYLSDMNRSLVFPLWSSFKPIVSPFDVIHCLGFYSSGIKIDGIPGRIHLASTIRSLISGSHRGFCFESRGQGHSPMLIAGLIILLPKVIPECLIMIEYYRSINNFLIYITGSNCSSSLKELRSSFSFLSISKQYCVKVMFLSSFHSWSGNTK